MATATDTPKKSAPARDDRVYHPLDRLRGIIRRYILIEGVLSVLIFLVAWFALALALDYGVFKAFAWDWVQHAGWGLRVAALGVALLILAGILVFRIVRRYVTEFSYPALALVLERRFPKVFGDRLITAVELADVERHSQYGYSPAMIRKTIEEARDLVDTVDVSRVFNWRRLRLMGLLAGGSVLALLVIGFASHAIAARAFQPERAAWKCYHVTTILFERDVLLMNTPWPRRALLELRDVPEAGIRVATNGSPPKVRVRAYRWVVADRSRPDGWRPLMWNEVTEEFTGVPVPALFDFRSGGTSRAKISVDTDSMPADAILENPTGRAQLGAVIGLEKYEQLQKVFDRLEQMADDPRYGRTLRKLDRPGEVTFKYTGLKTAGEGALKPEGASEYVGEITGLQEDVLFSVRAEDYRTPQRNITRVAPPALTNLAKVEYQPAYLHYASPEGGGWGDLKPLVQRMAEDKLSLTGDRSIVVVPAGTELVITGTTEKPIARAFARPNIGRVPGATPGSAALVPLKVTDGNTFAIEFRGEAGKVTSPVEFDLIVENEDGIRNESAGGKKQGRTILIQVTEDSAPVAELMPEVIRKVGKEYWVTPAARIPFNPESNVRDDNGLSKVAYRAAFRPADALFVQAARVGQFVRLVPAPAAEGNLGAVVVAAHDYARQVLTDDSNREQSPTYPVGQFYALDRALKRETLATIRQNVNVPRSGDKAQFITRVGLKTELKSDVTRYPNGLIDTFKWRVDGDYFDVGLVEVSPGKRMEVSPGDIQPRYEMQLTLEATDTNFNTGPKAARSDPINILVVSASDLLVEIGKDEERLGTKLDDAIKRVAAARAKYAFVRSKTERPVPDELDAVKVRSKDASQDVAKARELVDDAMRNYRRVEQECVVNRLNDNTVAEYGQFANRLDRALGESPAPVSRAEDQMLNAGKTDASPFGTLTPKATFPAVQTRMGEAQAALDAARFPDPGLVVTADNMLFNLEQELVALRALRGEAQSKERLRNLIKSIRDTQERIGRAIEEERIRQGKIRLADTPAIASVAQFFLSKGETKKIRQGINWRQFKEDTLKVKLTSSDPTNLIVPAELKLDFEKNNLDFDYEIRAGGKDGEYTITLTPEVGDKVEVRVQVR